MQKNYVNIVILASMGMASLYAQHERKPWQETMHTLWNELQQKAQKFKQRFEHVSEQDVREPQTVTQETTFTPVEKKPVCKSMSLSEAIAMVENAQGAFAWDEICIAMPQKMKLPYVYCAETDKTLPLFAHSCWQDIKKLTIIGQELDEISGLSDLREHDFMGLTNMQELVLVAHTSLHRMPRWIFSSCYVPSLKVIRLAACGFLFDHAPAAFPDWFRRECLETRDDIELIYSDCNGQTSRSVLSSVSDMGYRYSGLRWLKRACFETSPR